MHANNIPEAVSDSSPETVSIERRLRNEGVVFGEVSTSGLLHAKEQQIGRHRCAHKCHCGAVRPALGALGEYVPPACSTFCVGDCATLV